MDLTRKLYAAEIQEHARRKAGRSQQASPRALRVATAALVAEMVGGMQRSLDI